MEVRSQLGRLINLKGDIVDAQWGCIGNTINRHKSRAESCSQTDCGYGNATVLHGCTSQRSKKPVKPLYN